MTNYMQAIKDAAYEINYVIADYMEREKEIAFKMTARAIANIYNVAPMVVRKDIENAIDMK